MTAKETAAAFFQRHGQPTDDTGKFNIYRLESFCRAATHPYARRDFYKIMLLTKAEGRLHYADKTIDIRDNALVFGNPLTPYSWEGPTEGVTGFVCIFTEDFINSQVSVDSASRSTLFKAGGYPVLYPDESTNALFKTIFQQMLIEFQAGFVYKYDLLRNYIQVLIYHSLKLSPANEFYNPGSSIVRISDLFLELLERQFPIASPAQSLQLKSAGQYAAHLSIHTNYLNKALKEITGKTTTQLIGNRIISEAKALLLHSNWSVSEISYCLGFGHDSNFNVFFKKQTGRTPNQFRRQ